MWERSWSLAGVWRRTREVLKDDGLKALWVKALGETVYRRAYLYALNLDTDPPKTARLSASLLHEENCDALATLHPSLMRALVIERLRKNHLCFGVWEETRLVHAVWVGAGDVTLDYLGRAVSLETGDAYVYEGYSSPEYRRRGASHAAMAAVAAHLRGLGYRRILGIANPENRLGLTALPRWGYRRVGTLRCTRLGRRRWQFGRIPPRAECLRWDQAMERVTGTGHYLDPFLGALKRDAHLRLLRQWGVLPLRGALLKTDLFEEAAGPDALMDALCEGTAPVFGMDIAPAIVRQARARGGDARAVWVTADARSLPFRAGSLTAIVSTSTLDHFPDPSDLGRSLRELLRVLRPGGQLVITLDNRQNLFDPVLRLVHRLGWVPYYLGRSYRIGELRGELESAGFEVEATTAILHNPRLLAVASVRLARVLKLPMFVRAVQRMLVAAQRLEETRFSFYTGSFVAASARRPEA